MSTDKPLRPSIWRALGNTEYSLQWIDAGGIRTRTLAAGAQAAHPLVLLHGTGGHIENYAYNLAAHAQHFRTYAFDLVGHGYSDHPDIAYEIDAYIDHTLRFLDAMRIERAHFSGQSLGGWIGARLAARHPDRVARLVLNTAGGFTINREAMKKAQQLGRAAAAPTMTREAVRKRLEFLVRDPASLTDEIVDVRHAIYGSPGYAATMEKILCLQDPEVRERNLLSPEELGRIRAPTLVLWTDHDPIVSTQSGAEMAKLIPGAHFEIIDGCAHWPQYERPEVFNEMQLRFLRQP